MSTVHPRSLLYCSALNLHHIQSRGIADTLVIDLEDGVPSPEKDLARRHVEHMFSEAPLPGTALRLNPLRDTEGLHDLLLVQRLRHKPQCLVMTMVEEAAELGIVRALLGPECPRLLVTVETPRCLVGVHAVAAAADGLIFGSADYAASLGVRIGEWENMLHARSCIVAAAASAGIPAFDTACFALDSNAFLEQECSAVRSLGFTGKTAIHPSQLDIIHRIFTPTAAEYDAARAVVAASEACGDRLTRLGRNMIGPPFVKQARKVLARAAELDRRAPTWNR